MDVAVPTSYLQHIIRRFAVGSNRCKMMTNSKKRRPDLPCSVKRQRKTERRGKRMGGGERETETETEREEGEEERRGEESSEKHEANIPIFWQPKCLPLVSSSWENKLQKIVC